MEIWKDVIGYEGLYQVSNMGRVKSLRKGKRFNKIMKQTPNYKGYLEISFCVKGKDKKFKVHRLVAMAFIPNIDNKPLVNHKNGNKQDNIFSNLEWVTHGENLKHAYDSGLKRKLYGELNPYYKYKGDKHYNYGKHLSLETRKKISNSLKGKKLEGSHLENVKKSNIENSKKKRHKIICLNTLEVFESSKEAWEKYNISRSSINRCCNGYLKHAGMVNGEKAKWKKYEDYIKDTQ